MSDDTLYKLSYLHRIEEVKSLAPSATDAFVKFEEHVYAEGLFSVKMKEAIAIAVAHVTGCPYCIDTHVDRFKQAGGTKEEMMEAILIAASVKAGGAFAHGVNALNSFDRERDQEKQPAKAPECLC